MCSLHSRYYARKKATDTQLLPVAWKNRQHPKIYEVFANVIGRKDLWVSVDRYGVMRPTKEKKESGELVDRPEWRTMENWVHWYKRFEVYLIFIGI
jgi:hypothetical protein